MFQRIIVVLAAVLALTANVAQAQTPFCGDPTAINGGKTGPCMYPVPAFDCRGNWEVTISSAHLSVGKKLKIYLNDFSVTAFMNSYQVSPDGYVFCRGIVVGFPGSWADMRYNPNNGDAGVNISLPMPLTSVTVQAASRLFLNQSTQSLDGSLDGSVQDYSSNQLYTASLQGDLEAKRPSYGAKGRPVQQPPAQ